MIHVLQHTGDGWDSITDPLRNVSAPWIRGLIKDYTFEYVSRTPRVQPGLKIPAAGDPPCPHRKYFNALHLQDYTVIVLTLLLLTSWSLVKLTTI